MADERSCCQWWPSPCRGKTDVWGVVNANPKVSLRWCFPSQSVTNMTSESFGWDLQVKLVRILVTGILGRGIYMDSIYITPRRKLTWLDGKFPCLIIGGYRIHLHSWLGDFQPVILVWRGPVTLPVIPSLAFVGHPREGHPPGPALLKRCLTTPFTTFLCRQMGGRWGGWKPH